MEIFSIDKYKDLKAAGYYPDKEFTSQKALRQYAADKDGIILQLTSDQSKELNVSKYVFLTKRSPEEQQDDSDIIRADVGAQFAASLFGTLASLRTVHIQRKNEARADTVSSIARYLIKQIPKDLIEIAKTEKDVSVQSAWKKIASSFKDEADSYQEDFKSL